jgi:hypothetical protein
MLSAADNELLTRTGPDTAMGELFRRFWMPVLLSQELPEPDCAPVRVKIMGEELVAFRDTESRVGLVDPRCPHRGANLFFGRNEQCGLRCVYAQRLRGRELPRADLGADHRRAVLGVLLYLEPERPLTETERQRLRAGQSVHAAVDERWVPLRNRDNDYLIDRVDQKLRTFTGIRGISEQDACIQDSQGFIADRAREHLGPTDAAIIHFRRLMLGAARDLRGGIEPAAARNAAAYSVRSGSALADRSVLFPDVMVRRFGEAVGRVGRAPAGAQASSATYSRPPSSLRG